MNMKKLVSLAAALILILVLYSCTQLRPEQNDAPLPRRDDAIPQDEGGVTTKDTDNTGNAGNTNNYGAIESDGVSADLNSFPEGLADGVYTGRSQPDERGDYGEIKITIANEKVAKAEYMEYTKDGKPKSPDNGFEYEKALEAFDMLPYRLTITQNVEDIDDYAGATATTEKFREAAKNALSSGKK